MITGFKPIGTVGVMHGGPAVLSEFNWSMIQFVDFNNRYLCDRNEMVVYERASHGFHSWARNELVEKMRGDWLFQLDTDHAFDAGILGRLLERMQTHDLDVVTGLYQFKRAPHPPVLYGWHNNELVPLAGWNGDLIEVGASGAGNLLVRRRVFDRIRDELKEKPFDVIGQGGEDFGFFHRLKKLGVKAWCDTRVECHHLTTKKIAMKDFDADKLKGRTFKTKGKLVIKD